jgi:hypothetical protein
MKKRKPVTRRARDAKRLEKNDARGRGLFPEQPPKDIDQFRLMMARRIAIFIGNRRRAWRGCPEPVCRRQRACLAPRISCTNAEPVQHTPEQSARALAQVQRALREVQARQEKGE